MGRVSMTSEISSTGDGLTVGGSTSCLDGAGLVTHCFMLAFLFGAFLGATDNFRAGFLLLDFFWYSLLELS